MLLWGANLLPLHMHASVDEGTLPCSCIFHATTSSSRYAHTQMQHSTAKIPLRIMHGTFNGFWQVCLFPSHSTCFALLRNEWTKPVACRGKMAVGEGLECVRADMGPPAGAQPHDSNIACLLSHLRCSDHPALCSCIRSSSVSPADRWRILCSHLCHAVLGARGRHMDSDRFHHVHGWTRPWRFASTHSRGEPCRYCCSHQHAATPGTCSIHEAPPTALRVSPTS